MNHKLITAAWWRNLQLPSHFQPSGALYLLQKHKEIMVGDGDILIVQTSRTRVVTEIYIDM